MDPAGRLRCRGRISGEWREGSGWIVDDPTFIAQASQALALKYGWQFALLTFASRLFGRIRRRVIMEFTMD